MTKNCKDALHSYLSSAEELADSGDLKGDILKEGWIQTQSTKNEWKYRWLVLTTKSTATYKDASKRGKRAHFAHISSCKSAVSSHLATCENNCFSLETRNKMILFKAQDMIEKKLWIESFNICIQLTSSNIIDYESSVKEIWISKRSRYLKRWRRRLLIVNPYDLKTLPQWQRNPTEWLNIHDVTISDYNSDEITQLSSFKIISDKRTINIACDSEMDKLLCMNSIRICQVFRSSK